MDKPRFKSETVTVTVPSFPGGRIATGWTYRDGDAAAKAYAAAVGVAGKPGGWIYTPSGRPICQGWQSYTSRLVRRGIIRDLDGHGLSVISGKEIASTGRLVRNVFDRKPVLLVFPEGTPKP